MNFKVRGQLHNANARELRYLTNYWRWEVDFNFNSAIGNKNVTITLKVRGQGHSVKHFYQ